MSQNKPFVNKLKNNYFIKFKKKKKILHKNNKLQKFNMPFSSTRAVTTEKTENK